MELKTPEEMAEYLKVNRNYLQNDRAKENPVIPYIKMGHLIRYDKSEVIKKLGDLKVS